MCLRLKCRLVAASFPRDSRDPDNMEKPRHLLFISIVLLLVVVFSNPLWALVRVAVQRDEYSHTVLIPLIAICLIYWQRAELFDRSKPSFGYAGLFVGLAGLMLYAVGSGSGLALLQQSDPPSAAIAGLVIACIGAFIFSYGWRTFWRAVFPLGFLLLMIPLPDLLLSKIVYYLQVGSSDTAALILRLCDVPFFREGFIFRLPGISIEVAQECSGIRSSTALLITIILAANFMLRSNWRRLLLCVLVLPISLAKNGVRIATLSMLSVYVDRAFLFGRLHRSGGFIFFFLGLALFWPVLRLLQRGEARNISAARKNHFSEATADSGA